jgi:hypothetical protein
LVVVLCVAAEKWLLGDEKPSPNRLFFKKKKKKKKRRRKKERKKKKPNLIKKSLHGDKKSSPAYHHS